MGGNPHPTRSFTKNDPRRINKPKGAISISTAMRNLLSVETPAVDIEGAKKKLTIAEQLAVAVYKKALQGDAKHAEMILERMEGKVVQPIENTNRIDLSGVDEKKLDEIISKLKSV